MSSRLDAQISNIQGGLHRAMVGFAGSRHGSMPQSICNHIVSAFSRHGSSFLVGCAPGIDESFRTALAASRVHDRCTVHCAFPSRMRAVKQVGLNGVCTVSDAPSAAAAPIMVYGVGSLLDSRQEDNRIMLLSISRPSDKQRK